MDKQAFTDEINDAILAHGAWKERLRTAAESHETGLPVADIGRDDCCRLGRWLRSVPPAEGGAHLETVRHLHAEFHKQAGDIAAMIQNGRDAQAISALEGGDFKRCTTALVMELGHWRAAL